MTRQRTIAISLVLLTVVGLGVGGSVGVMGQDGEAQVRIAHLSPDAPAVDVLVDNETVLEGAEYRDVSDYLNVSAGEHSVTIQTSENESVVFEQNVTFESDTQYTAAALGSVENDTFNVSVFEDDFETPGEGNATVRLIHASPDAPAVSVMTSDANTTLFENVSFGNASDYQSVEAGDYTLNVLPANQTDGEAVATADVTLESGTAYSAIAVGYLSPDEAPADEEFEVLLVTDTPGQMMETTPAETTTVEGNETTPEEEAGITTTTEA